MTKTSFRPRWWQRMTPEQRLAADQEPDLGASGTAPPEPPLAEQALSLIERVHTLTPGQIRSTLTDLSLAFEDIPDAEQDETTRHLIYRPFLFLCEYDLGHRSLDELRSLIAAVGREGP